MHSVWYQWQHGRVVTASPEPGISKQMVHGSRLDPAAFAGKRASTSSKMLGSIGVVLSAPVASLARSSMKERFRRRDKAGDKAPVLGEDPTAAASLKCRSFACRCRAPTRSISAVQGVWAKFKRLRSSRMRARLVCGRLAVWSPSGLSSPPRAVAGVVRRSGGLGRSVARSGADAGRAGRWVVRQGLQGIGA